MCIRDSNKRLYVVDAFCGANKDTRMAVRFIMEVAWQAHFVTNMFIKPTAEELENFEPEMCIRDRPLRTKRSWCSAAALPACGWSLP